MSSEFATGPPPFPGGEWQQPEFVPTSGPAQRRVRPLWLVVIAGAVVAGVFAVVVGVTTGGGGSGGPSAATQFDKAYQAFHKNFSAQSAALTSDLAHAESGGALALGDPSFIAATNDAKALAFTYQQYAASVQTITVPLNVRSGAAEILDTANAGAFLMNQASEFFTPAGMQSVLDTQWPQVQTAMSRAEGDVRDLLGLPVVATPTTVA